LANNLLGLSGWFTLIKPHHTLRFSKIELFAVLQYPNIQKSSLTIAFYSHNWCIILRILKQGSLPSSQFVSGIGN
jgi:hypothetical protein